MKAFYLAKDWWQLVLMAVVCYFIGCFNFAKLISKSKNRDITKIGSGNPGTMNMSREFGLKVGLLTFILDALKGGIPVLVGYLIYKDYYFAGSFVSVADFTRYFCGVFVIVGHIFPITMKFKGGKGIAATFGTFWFGLACGNPWWALIVLGILVGVLLFIFLTEWGSLGSLSGVIVLSICQMVRFILEYGIGVWNGYLVAIYACILAIVVLTWGAHHANIARLFAGEEHHTSIRKLSKKK